MINIIHSQYFLPIVFALVCWTVPWKGVALWKAARRKDVWWFIALLLINSLGILEIVYIFVFNKRKQDSDSVENGEVCNNMKISKPKIVALSIVLVVLFILVIGQWLNLRKAHSTFENYYVFRGCVQLVEKTNMYGICKTNTGQTIKIVKYQNKWYLAGDLPWACLGNVCFGI